MSEATAATVTQEQAPQQAQAQTETQPVEQKPQETAAETQATQQQETQEEQKPENHDIRRMKTFMRRAFEAEAKAEVLENQMRTMQQPPAQAGNVAPIRDQFGSDLEYFEAARAYDRAVLQQQIQQAAVQQPQAEVTIEKREAELIREKPDYEDVVETAKYEVKNFKQLYNFSPIATSPHSADIIYELAKKPDVADRIINKVPYERAAYEIGKLEAEIVARKTAGKPATTVSKAPAPIKPLASGGASGATNVSPDKLNDREWWNTYGPGRYKKKAS